MRKDVKECLIEGCEKPSRVRGFCSGCYATFRYHYNAYGKLGKSHVEEWMYRLRRMRARCEHIEAIEKQYKEDAAAVLKRIFVDLKALKRKVRKAA